MNTRKMLSKFLLPLAALGGLTLLSPVQADVPRVAVEGHQGGTLAIQGPTQFRGSASDSEGLKYIYATIQNRADNTFLTPTGQYSTQPTQLPVDFTLYKPQTVWRTASYNLPNGNYIFRIRVEDARKARSEIVEVPFSVSAAGTQKATPATAANQPPGIAIQFPKNGAVMQGSASFRGIANDDQAVVNVVATIMNSASGQFLGANGQFSNAGQLNMQTQQGQRVQWASPNIALPPGNYLFSVKGIDNNGVESRWSQVKFSIAGQARTTTATQPAAAAAPTGKAANGMSFCSNAGKDADGDGFGWENNTSCVVAGSRADTHPNCASSSSDPDGDGYGWENERSCIVVVHCASASSDPDGDGFGWENNKSCIVLKKAANSRHPACTSAGSDPDGDGYGWENNKTCLVAK